ncbi:MAG: T9SS type A sorting domain-containing protein [Saprospiraceae bacterium]|nr:T9SS type A sorting domain-containing protein [Saprospiraceae bacterium]
MKKIYIFFFIILVSNVTKSQQLGFDSAKTLFELNSEHYNFAHPMIPIKSSDDIHFDFIGKSGDVGSLYTYGQDGIYTLSQLNYLNAFNYILEVVDFDNDGLKDLLTDFGIYKNTGSNNYVQIFFQPPFYIFLGMTDYNKDGLMDIVINTEDFASGKENLIILKNKGDLKFEEVSIEKLKKQYRTLTTYDIDNNGYEDLIFTVTGIPDNPASIYFNNGNGGFITKEVKESLHDYNPIGLRVTDMDNDNDGDLILIGEDNGLWFFENKDNFTSQNPTTNPQLNSWYDIFMLNTGDLNNDGLQDIIVATQTQTSITLQCSKALGHFTFDVIKPIGNVKGGVFQYFIRGNDISRNLHVFDYNGDGKRDIVFTSGFDKKQIVFINTTLISHTGDSEITFEIFPNPVTDILNIRTATGFSSLVKIYDIYGQVLISKPVLSTSAELEMGQLSKGTYFIETTDSAGNTSVKKFTKI